MTYKLFYMKGNLIDGFTFSVLHLINTNLQKSQNVQTQ